MASTGAVAGDFTRQWFKSSKKAAWTISTTFIVLVVPLIICMDRDGQQADAESQNFALTGGAPK